MNADAFFLIKVIFGIVAAIFTLSVAIFTFLDTAQNEKTEATQEWFRRKWEGIDKSRWLTLPERIARWLLTMVSTFPLLIAWLLYRLGMDRISFIGNPILFIFACFLRWGPIWSVPAIILVFPILIMFLSKKFPSKEKGMQNIAETYCWITFFLISVLNIYLWFQIILQVDLYYATLLMLLFVPFFCLAAVFLISVLLEILKSRDSNINWTNYGLFFSVGGGCGFAITLFAMSIGHFTEPTAFVPRTLQMLISNVIFDGLTMAFTFVILSKALSSDGMLRLPIAVIVDIGMAAILASCSLYLGLVFTNKALTLQEVINILFARSADSGHFEFSPYFWVMHTTFIPTVIYLVAIFTCWSGKALLLPIRWFFGKGHENKNPLKLTAVLCGIFVAIFAVLAVATGFMQEWVKENKSRVAPQTIIENHN